MAAKSNNYVSVESDVMCIFDNSDEDDCKLLENGLDELALFPAFHYEGDTANHIILEGGQVIFFNVVKRPGRNTPAYREYLAINTSTGDQFCTLCDHHTKVTGNKMSNTIKHIEQCHYNVIPLLPKDLPVEYVKDKIATWKYARTHSRLAGEPTTMQPAKKKQCTLFDLPCGMQKYQLAAQKKLIAQCVCLGLGPLSFADNPGGKHLLKYFNDGIVPRGLGRNAITREVNNLYEQNVSYNKKLLFPILVKNATVN
jgi:hypothetical protein